MNSITPASGMLPAIPAALCSRVSSILASVIVYLIELAMRIISIEGEIATMPLTNVLPNSPVLMPDIRTDAMPAIRNIRATMIIV